MAKKNNHHLYQDTNSEIWYFQKKVKGVSKPYKFSLETTSVVEARRKRDEYLKQIEIHGHIPNAEVNNFSEAMVFGEVAQQWSEIVKNRLEETTFNNYRKVMNIHVLPWFGNMPIEAISSLDIEKFISKLNCCSKTKQNILTPLRVVMKFAKKHKIIQSNPFLDVEPIKKTKGKQKQPLNLDEIRKFIDEVEDFWKPLFILLFFSGIRIAEASGLKWKNVNFDEGVIKIRKNLVRGEHGKVIYKKPKTEGSIRDVKVPPFIIEALQEQHKRTWKGSGENFVFLNKAERPLNRHTLNNSVLKTTLKKIGLDTQISIKDTRASYITNALDQNERMSFVQSQVGHTTTRMIVDHYYRHIPAPDDGTHMEKAWNSAAALSEDEILDP
jgi:integrase